MTRHQVPDGVRAEPISKYLRRAWPLLPGHVLRELMKSRDVRVNGVRIAKEQEVRGGDLLEIYGDAKYFEPMPEIIFDDGRLIAAVKPQGLPALPDRDGVGADTMEARLRRVHPQARLCHRLDAATGGVMLAAADETVYAQAFEAFKRHMMRKRYRAVLCGKPQRDEMTLRAFLQKDARRSTVRVLDRAAGDAKEIVTRSKLLSALGGGMYLAELEPITGRTHQLRAHMAHMHCPILGDDKYGDRERNRRMNFVGRLCLWCETMEIPEGCPMTDYVGMQFHASAPQWLLPEGDKRKK